MQPCKPSAQAGPGFLTDARHLVRRAGFVLSLLLLLGPAMTASAPAQAQPVPLPGWSVVRISIPKDAELRDAQVELKTASSETLILTRGIRSHAGIILESVEWVGEPARARVTLRKDDARAELFADASAVAKDESLARRRPQLEIEAKFIEMPEETTKKLPLLAEMSAAALGALKRELPDGVTGIIEEKDYQSQLFTLNQQRGVDLLSAPRVTTGSAQRAQIEIIREFRYATDWDAATPPKKGWLPKAFATENLGLTFDVEPVLGEDGTIDLKLEPRVVQLLGFIDVETRQPLAKAKGGSNLIGGALRPGVVAPPGRSEPVFHTRKAAIDCTVKPGQTVVFMLGERDLPAGFVPPSKGRVLVGLVTARRVTADNPPHEQAPAKFPTANPVPGKPGFVTSPYEPTLGFIDVRGFPAGTEVRDPYTGKVFCVPAGAANPPADR